MQIQGFKVTIIQQNAKVNTSLCSIIMKNAISKYSCSQLGHKFIAWWGSIYKECGCPMFITF